MENTNAMIERDSTIKDSGERRRFATGATRDYGEGKLRCEFLHPLFELAMARWMSFGAIKYEDWNFAKGMPASVFVASAERHRLKFRLGMTDEDHLAAWAFNIMGLVMLREGIATGRYSSELWDLPPNAWCGSLSNLEDAWGQYERDVAKVAQAKQESVQRANGLSDGSEVAGTAGTPCTAV